MPTLVIHGGAGRIRAERQDAYRAGLAAALDAGFAVLDAGGSAVDAVCAAVASMEADRARSTPAREARSPRPARSNATPR